MSSQDYDLEENEKLLYSDDTVSLKISAKTIFWLLIGILGFPFYTWIIMAGCGCTVIGMSLQEMWEQLHLPVYVLAGELILFIPFSISLSRKIPEFIWAPNKIVVTNKRIFLAPEQKDKSHENLPKVLSESRFEEITYISTEIYKTTQFLKVKVKTRNSEGELVEAFHTYQVKDARAVYASLPSDLVQRRGHSSPAAAKEKSGLLIGRIFGVLFLVALVAFGFFFELQESTTALSKQGHSLIKKQKYDEAERVLELAYKRNTKLPFQISSFFGPVCYRLAVTKLALGKTEEAIQLFYKAVVHCQKSGEDSKKQGLVFRSYARLGHIYQKKGDENKASEYYEKMLGAAALEHRAHIRTACISAYVDYLKSKGHQNKAKTVARMQGADIADSTTDLYPLRS